MSLLLPSVPLRYATENTGPQSSLTLSTWDYGGQDMFVPIQHLFLTRKGAYLIVFDMAKVLPTSHSLRTAVELEITSNMPKELRRYTSLRSDDSCDAFTAAVEQQHQGNDAEGELGRAYSQVRKQALSTIDFWLKSVAVHAPGAPVLLVGTSKDLVATAEEHKQVSDELWKLIEALGTGPTTLNLQPCTSSDDNEQQQQQQQQQLWFFPVNNAAECRGVSAPSSASSSATATTEDPVVDVLREAILECVRSDPLDYINESIPLTMRALCDSIHIGLTEKSVDQTVTWEEFGVLAEECGVPSNQLDAAATLLHELGSLAYFWEPKELRNTVVLDPQWLINVITCVIRRPGIHGNVQFDKSARKHLKDLKLMHEDGILHRPLLEHLWKDYPVEQHDMLLALLQRFGLASPITREEDFFVVPALLPTTKDIPAPEWVTQAVTSLSPQEYALHQPLELRCRVGEDTDMFLPVGLFERLVALLVSCVQTQRSYGLRTRKQIRTFELTRTSGTFVFDGFEFFLRVHHTDNCIKVHIRHPLGRSTVASSLLSMCMKADEAAFGGNLGFTALLWGERLEDVRDVWKHKDRAQMAALSRGLSPEILSTWFEAPQKLHAAGVAAARTPMAR